MRPTTGKTSCSLPPLPPLLAFTLIELPKKFSIFDEDVASLGTRFSNHQTIGAALLWRSSVQSRIENPKSKIPHAPRGFTLIELLTVIAIIGILAAILIPTVARVRQSARDTQCVATIRQFAIATQLFAEDHKGRLPETAYSNYGHYDLIDYFNAKRKGGDRITMFSCRVKPGPKDPDNPNWIYGLNVFISEQPISSITQPSRLILATCSTSGWLDTGAMSGGNTYLKITPKPHSGKVSVVRLAGNVTREKVSTLIYADVRRDHPNHGAKTPADETTYFFGGDPQYDR